MAELVDQWTYDLRKQHNLIVHQEKQNEERICQLQIRKRDLLKNIPPSDQDVTEGQDFAQEMKVIPWIANNPRLAKV